MAGFGFDLMASCKGVKPVSDPALGFAPASNRAMVTLGFSLNQTASCKGVKPVSDRCQWFAPAFTRVVMTLGFSLNAAAKWKGVKPVSDRALGSAPAFTRVVMTAGFVLKAAMCKGVLPCLSLAFGSAPAFSRAVISAGVPFRAASCKGVFSWAGEWTAQARIMAKASVVCFIIRLSLFWLCWVGSGRSPWVQGWGNLTGTYGCLFSFLPVSGNPIWGKKSGVAVRVSTRGF